jgi:uncharacterized protein YndB with AHSA1/START domain
MRKGKYLLKNENGSATILDAIIAIGISVAFFIVFIYYANALYTIQDEPGIDLEVKSVGLMETLINSPGQTSSLYPEWQEERNEGILRVLGLGASHTIQYGTLEIIDENTIRVIDGPYPKSNSIGIEKTCFLAGTQIVMADESYKNIEDIIVGDFVKSYNEKSQRIEDKQVIHVFHHKPEEMGDYYLVINNQLRVTPNHRFYVEGHWIFADELIIGDSLFYPSTDYTVFSIEKIFERTNTYNFEVEGYHNYFVAMEPTNVLVHNAELAINLSTNPNPPQGSAPCTITFSCEVMDVIPPYRLKYVWDFGEGEPFTESLVTENPHSLDYTYNNPGIYDVNITITNLNNGDMGSVEINDIPIYPGPKADFTWFDLDGPFGPGTNICCNGSISSYSGPSATFEWYLDGSSVGTGEKIYISLGDGDEHSIKLELTDSYGTSDSHTKEVQANVLPTIKIDSKPWVLTGKEIYPDIDSDTFRPYSPGYYVQYTLPEGAPEDIRIFELKEKTNTEQPVIGFKKIENLTSNLFNNYGSYVSVKDALGLNSSKVVYNFCIEFKIYNEDGTVFKESAYGASYDNCIAKASTSKQVLVYFPPTADRGLTPGGINFNWIINAHPKFRQAEVTISVFQGGAPPL